MKIDFNDFYNICDKKEISKNDLLNVLKEYCRDISIFDLMKVSNELFEEMKFVQDKYRKENQTVYIKYLLNRVKEIIKDKNDYDTLIDREKFIDALDTLKKFYKSELKVSKTKSPLVFIIVSLYSVFIIEEPIHPVEMPLPGSLKIIKKNNNYYCPVKNANLKSPNALCKFCISKQLDF